MIKFRILGVYLRALQSKNQSWYHYTVGVGSRSLRAALFSETGIWPIKYRRVYLALKNLCHLITLEDCGRPAWNALQESLSLARSKKISWINDLCIVLSRLYIPVDLDISGPLTETRVQEPMKAVKKAMEAGIDHEIEHSSRTKELLSNRLEMDKETGRMVKKSLDFRHYLRVKTAEHRRALTRMVLSSHSLAVERRRWKERGKNIVPREWRLCRFCEEEVEDPAHALFMSDHPPLIQLREVFLTKLYTEVPTIRGQFKDPIGFFAEVLARREITPVLAKLAFDVLKVYDASPMFLVEPPTAQP
jgi:hypothetical protein